MADLIKRQLGIEPKLVVGGTGEFSVLVGDKIVAKKGLVRFPSDRKILDAVRAEVRA